MEKKEIPASLRFLEIIIRGLYGSCTNPRRFMVAALLTIRTDHGGSTCTNAHDASMVRYSASAIQGGSATGSYNGAVDLTVVLFVHNLWGSIRRES